MTEKTMYDFYERLAQRESGGNYKAKNSFNFIGKYQMGEAALHDSGYYVKSNNNYYTNDWSGKFTGKDGVYNLNDFINKKEVQEKAIREYHKVLWERMKSRGSDKYIGKKINGTVITPSGIIAAAHLKGDGFVDKYLKNNGAINAQDGYGTDIMEYFNFANYNMQDITGPIFTPYTYKLYDKALKKPGSYSYSDFFPLKKLEEIKNSPTGYAADINDIFYTNEDIDEMTSEEFNTAQKIIDNQIKNKIAITRKEAQDGVKSGALVWVEDYQRDDGTKVKGYYRRR